MFRTTALALTTAATLALPACGSTSDADQVRHTMKSWFQAIADGRGTDACRMLTDAGRRGFTEQANLLLPPTCVSLVAELHDMFTPTQRAAISRISVRRVIVTEQGTKAIIEDEDVDLPSEFAPDPNGLPMVLRRVHGGWKIDDIG